ncbi:MAG: radical SAM protein, partial [Patescibacteria group bacterium]
VRSVVFEDYNLLMAKKYAHSLFSLMIQRKVDLKWFGSAFAVWCFTDEVIDLMRDSGCVGVNIAIESGNERVLRDIVHKPIKNLMKVPGIIEKVKSKGMFCIANFIIGFPGEKWDEIRETIHFAEHCGADYVKFFVAVPLYGTELYHIAKRMNLLTHNDEYPRIDWRYSQIKSDEWTTKDISILRAYEWERINFSKDRIQRTAEIWHMSVEQLNEIRKRTRDTLAV